MDESSKEIKNAEPETSNYLPLELQERILSMLPVQSLKRFQAVCKDWYKSIRATQFVSAHVSSTNSRNDNTLFFVGFAMHRAVYCDGDGALNVCHILRIPVELSYGNMHVCGSSNGLICFSDHTQHVILWNPSIKRLLHLPESNIDFLDKDSLRATFGFAFDHITNDFKVLRTNNLCDIDIMVEVFSLSTKSWKLCTGKIPFREISDFQVDLNGFAHWIGLDDDAKLMIISFDVHQEVFGSIMPPAPLAEDDDTHWFDYPVFLFLFEESLVLIHYVREYDENIRKSRTRYDFWKLEEYGNSKSWHLWHSIHCYVIRTPLGFRKNGQFLWNEPELGEFISTNLDNYTETSLGRSGNVHLFLNYVESLALLDTTTITRWDA